MSVVVIAWLSWMKNEWHVYVNLDKKKPVISLNIIRIGIIYVIKNFIHCSHTLHYRHWKSWATTTILKICDYNWLILSEIRYADAEHLA